MDYLIILATPAFFVAVGVTIVRFRKLSWRDDVGLRLPSAGQTAIWMAAFVLLFIAQEQFAQGDEAWGSWRGKYDAGQVAIRIVAISLLYPLAEEFFFRGVALGAIARRFGSVAAVLITAAAFALLHTQYDWPVWILFDGLLFGLSRVSSGSVYLPMLLHVIGNTYSVWERLQ